VDWNNAHVVAQEVLRGPLWGDSFWRQAAITMAKALTNTPPRDRVEGNARPILCLDFDGVIHDFKNGWQGPDVVDGDPVPGAWEFLWQATNDFDVHIFSSRSAWPEGIEAMKEFIKEECWIPYLNKRSWRLFVDTRLHFPREKPAAHVTLDDRAIQFRGEWPEVADLITFTPWNRDPGLQPVEAGP